jgi:hypothetical protein
MNFNKAKDTLLLALISTVVVYTGNKIGSASDSIVELNQSVKILIERSESHKLRIERIENTLYGDKFLSLKPRIKTYE